MSQARGGGCVTGVGPGRRRVRQAFLGLTGPRCRGGRLVPGGKLGLRVPGTGITGERRVPTGRVAPGPAGRAPGSGRAVVRPARAGRAMLVTRLERAPGTGTRGVSPTGPRHRRGAQRRHIPRVGEPGLPRPGPARGPPDGQSIASGRQVPSGGELDGFVSEGAAGRRIGIIPGRAGSPPVRRCGDLIAPETHVGSVSLCATLNVVSGVFPGGTVVAECSGVAGSHEGHCRRLAATGGPAGCRRGCGRGP